MTHRWHCLQQRIADYTTQCQAKFVEIGGSKLTLNVRTILIMELFPFSIQGQFVYHIAQTIFTCMDKNNRLKCRQVSTEWKQCIDTKTNLWSGVSTLNYIKAAEEGRIDICKVCSSVFSASTLSRFASVILTDLVGPPFFVKANLTVSLCLWSSGRKVQGKVESPWRAPLRKPIKGQRQRRGSYW